MTMVSVSSATKALKQISSKFGPTLKVEGIRVAEEFDHFGLDILRISIVFSRRPEDSTTFRKIRWSIADEFHNWLAKHKDDRFPHFGFRSIEEDDLIKRELAGNE